jgi:hypothetical protein
MKADDQDSGVRRRRVAHDSDLPEKLEIEHPGTNRHGICTKSELIPL